MSIKSSSVGGLGAAVGGTGAAGGPIETPAEGNATTAASAARSPHLGGARVRPRSRITRRWPGAGGPSPAWQRTGRPLQHADVEVIGLAVDDDELRGLVERSRPGAVSAPSSPDEPGSGATDAGVLVLTPRGHARHALQRLTGRERQVLALMAEGRSNHAIASHLFVTEYTVEKHIKNIFAALLLAPSRTDHRRVLAVLTYLAAATTGESHHNIRATITI